MRKLYHLHLIRQCCSYPHLTDEETGATTKQCSHQAAHGHNLITQKFLRVKMLRFVLKQLMTSDVASRQKLTLVTFDPEVPGFPIYTQS